MFTNITIKNFRCFPVLQLPELARVNLIAGKNNTGKTAVLEAIQIHNRPNDIAQAVSVAKLRGIADPAKDVSEWASWLFLGKAGSQGFEISSYDSEGRNRSLSAWLVDSITARERFPDVENQLLHSFRADVVASPAPRLVFQFDGEETTRFSIAAWAFGFATIGARVNWNPPSTFLGSSPSSADQDLRFFGEVERLIRQEDILPALRVVEPRLKRLSLVPIAGESVVHGDIGRSPLVPIHLMGEGLRRLLSLLLAIVNSKDGYVLIDEIENGLHHSILKDVWKAIAVAARQNNVQVFATTHSYECIQAAHAAFMESQPYDLKLFRLEQTDSTIRKIAYDQMTLDTSIDMNYEVR